MNCPTCQTPNPESAKFCMNCGSKLVLQCPQCNAEVPQGAKFCLNCGHKIVAAAEAEPEAAPAPAAQANSLEKFIPKELLSKLENARSSGTMEGERRIITMLFCDVQGSTGAAAQLDPEEWAERGTS